VTVLDKFQFEKNVANTNYNILISHYAKKVFNHNFMRHSLFGRLVFQWNQSSRRQSGCAYNLSVFNWFNQLSSLRTSKPTGPLQRYSARITTINMFEEHMSYQQLFAILSETTLFDSIEGGYNVWTIMYMLSSHRLPVLSFKLSSWNWVLLEYAIAKHVSLAGSVSWTRQQPIRSTKRATANFQADLVGLSPMNGDSKAPLKLRCL
jgi:hypothetical protein